MNSPETGSVQQIDLDVDSWMAAPGADQVITPSPAAPESKKPSFFSASGPDVSFLDKDEPAETPESVSSEEVSQLVDDFNPDSALEPGPAGRTSEGNPLVGFLKKRIESKEMFTFDDYDEEKQSLDEYLGSLGDKDIEELWQANLDTLKQEVAARTPQEFFDSLPEELQQAARYVMEGGQDLKSLFRALAQVEEVRELSPESETDQEAIVRQYLQATGYGDGDSELIEDEIQTWRDLGKLEQKAKQFKPKLDKMQEEIVAYQIAQQEERRQQQEAAAQAYMQNVFEALRPGEISGIKLDKRTQNLLYNGLVSPDYPSISGRGTNLLGHLLEKYQYVEPNYPLIAEALWLLSNPDDYRQSLMQRGASQSTERTVRQLKTEQARKQGSSQNDLPPASSRKIPRQQNIFARR